MNPKDDKARSKIPSLVTAAGSGPIPKGHVPMEESATCLFSQWLDSELESLEYRFRQYATPLSVKGAIGR